MPELPEVETVRRGLERLIIDKKIVDVAVFYEKMIEQMTGAEFKQALVGAKFTQIKRRGKYLLLQLDNDQTIVSHLRMEGKYFYHQAPCQPEKHTHVVFSFEDNSQLHYNDSRKFGRMRLVASAGVKDLPAIKKLGVEPLGKDFTPGQFKAGLSRHHKAIKPTLLDQTVVCGLGNIYADEVLWQAKINPTTPADEITLKQVKQLIPIIQDELRRSIAMGGTTVKSYTDATHHTGAFQSQLDVYGRTGEPCRRCHTPIKKIKLAQRGTHFCPHCQGEVSAKYENKKAYR